MTKIWTGTAAVENGETLVTVASGDPLSDANCSQGCIVVIGGVVYFVNNRVDTLSFHVTRPYAGADDAGATLEISPLSEATTNLVNLAAVVARVQSQLRIFDKNSQGLFFTRLGTTGAADPGPGKIAFNNPDPPSVTEIYIDVIDGNARPVDGLIDLWSAGTVILVRSLASTAYEAYQLPSGVVVQSGWRIADATYIGHDGVIADDEDVTISWLRVGEGLKIDFVGSFAYRATFNTEPAGFMYLSTNGNGSTDLTPSLYRKNTAASDGWSTQVPFQGPQGDRGWSPRFGFAYDGPRVVLQLLGYVGGQGDAPTAGVGQYVSAGGLTAIIGDAVDLRGPQGLSAYQVAVANGFVGDEATWLLSIRGVNGTDPGVFFDWDDGTTEADPGPGKVRANASNLLLATEYYVSKTNRAGDDIAARLLAMGTSTNTVKGGLTLTRSGGNAQAAADVTSVTDAGAFVKIVVANPAGTTGFIVDDPVSLQFERAGDQGSSDLASVVGAVNGAAAKLVPVAADVVLVSDSQDAGSGKKVTMAGAGLFLGTRVVDVCAAVAGSKGVAARLFVPGAVADGFRSNDGIDDAQSENYALDAGDGRVVPAVSLTSQIADAAGVQIGDLTFNGGLAAAFDGVTSQAYASAAVETNSGYDGRGFIGKNFSGAPKKIVKAEIYATSDFGFDSTPSASVITLTLKGKNGAAPNATGTDGTALGTWSGADVNGAMRSIDSSDVDTEWDYVWVLVEDTLVARMCVAELRFFEPGTLQDMTLITTPAPTEEVAEAAVVTLLVRPLESIELNVDLTVEVSRDGGANFAPGDLVQLHGIGPDRYCETAPISLASQGAGDVDLIVRVKTFNAKSLEIRGLQVEVR